MRTQLETLGEEFKLAGNIWWREPTILWVWTWDALALWGQWPYLVILFVWEFCDEMFRYCEDNTYIIVIVTYGSYTWSYGVHFIVPEKTLVISMRTTLFGEDFGLHCGLAITVVERLQRYNCIWLTYIDNVEQNILFYIEVGSCEMLSLCGKTDLEKELCVSDYVLYSEEGCTDTLCESLRSWEVSQLVTNELVIHVWMRTSLIWELLEVFRWFWIHLVKLSFVDL